MLNSIILAGLLVTVAGCSTWADERAKFYHARYLTCLGGDSTTLSLTRTPAEWPREKRCLHGYQEDMNGLNSAMAAGSVTVQPVYVLGR